MNKRITPEQKEEVRRLYDNGKGLSIVEIARQKGLNYQTVYGQTRLNEVIGQRTNPETGQPFTSLSELKRYRARQKISPETEQPFVSQTKYLEFRARQKINPETGQPFTSLSELRRYQARQKISPETGKPFESRHELKDYQATQRAKYIKANKKLVELINMSLRVLDKNLTWLANEIGVSRQMTSLYAQGKSIPRTENLSKLFIALDTPFKTLDDLVNEDL